MTTSQADRQIKFRAWDGKKMRYPDAHMYVLRFDGTIGCFDERIQKYDTVEWRLMQFTGLHDKNGKEVYEGDIVKTATGKPMVVGWSNRFASFVIHREGWAFQHWFGEALEASDCEVVGDIYQNSNLLQG